MILGMALVVMALGPLLQGLGGFPDPNAYVFAPVIAVAALPLAGPRDMGRSLRLAALFLAIGFGCIGLWWLGSQVTPRVMPGWLPLAVTLAGAALALVPAWTARR